MATDLEALKTKYGNYKIPPPESPFDVLDGDYVAEITNFGDRYTSGGSHQLYITLKVLSEGKSKGKQPQATFQLPSGDDSLSTLTGDALESSMTGVRIFAQTFGLVTGLPAPATFGDVMEGIKSESLKRTLVGRKAQIRVKHNEASGYTNIRIIRGIGPSPKEIAPQISPKTTRPTPKTNPAKPKAKPKIRRD